MGKSIIEQEEGCCYLCGRWMKIREKHHIFGGSNRKWSEKYGLTVYLCCECHRGRSGVHFNAEIMDELHKTGQQAFEKHHTRAEFMKIFGRNYLENENEKKPESQSGTGFSGIIWMEDV